MKFLSSLLLASLLTQAAAVPTSDCTDGFDCRACVVCKGIQTSGGFHQVYIDSSQCKGEEISWMCCAQSGCELTEPSETENPGKQEETTLIVVKNVPLGTSSLTIQVHDGQAAGDEDVFSETCGGGGNGNGNGNNNGCSDICEVVIDLSTCPTDCCDPGLLNDPHLKNWVGEWFDYMGECDLKLMHAPKFDGKQDIDIHVRTTIEFDWSYIETAALRIGNDILEISGWGDYAVNGIEQALTTEGAIPTIGGYEVDHYQPNRMKNHVFNVMIAEDHNITITSFKDWVSVKVIGGDFEKYGEVSGLMGTYGGRMVGRNGEVIKDMIQFGQDWQVLPEEGNFFRTVREPQYPQLCNIPTPIDWSRRLSAVDSVDQEAAEQACAAFNGNAFKFCVNDVLVSGDVDMAKSAEY